MMLPAAADSTQFASSPSGYVITILVSVLVVGGGWWLSMIYRDQRELRRESATQSQALAVLIARVDPKLGGMDDLTERVAGVERDMLLMVEWRRQHNEWSQQERDRLMEALRGHAAAAPAPRPVRH